MASSKLPSIPSLRTQQLYLELASLQASPPPGVYVTISPTDPTLWSGVLFVQKGTIHGILPLGPLGSCLKIALGPYASAILRFQVRFPRIYPDLPPIVRFDTDIFHPLLVPLTTYTFTTSSSDTDTVSATDEERLPPGGFSLRHGFPHWFGRAKRSATNSASSSRNVSSNPTADGVGAAPDTSSSTPAETNSDVKDGEPSSVALITSTHTSSIPTGEIYQSEGVDVPVAQLFNYIRETFDNEDVIDSIPLEAAGNPGAWHAWQSHRRHSRDVLGESKNAEPQQAGTNFQGPAAGKESGKSRLPGQWNWTGVWQKRAQAGIRNSYLESVLFGNSPRNAADDLIRFQKLDNDILAEVKTEIIGPARN
ncbi:hypothetical protein LOZ61_001642 [Ophidiomyces ophidiicola]|nr:hypothetical protein LOZ61_001642 [Ophidiomyces ophidiicola]KAI1929887.1 hypothetical protein LOZ60_001355 [Ophidiomyces ophidiicola]KAI1963120.1 hypothetical protein LOZ59_001902 [Ophidiomyces ophidiicola]KAI2016395.1 hypothetical protein LOZ49_000090 [Ophidiomyces ophidiicola]KAI2144521.1 hypothetical protein LOZ29_000796 [Ophidiomyces ophidiicola]